MPAGHAPPQLPKSVSRLPASALELLVAPDDHQQLHVEDGCIYGVFANLIGRDQAGEEFGFVHFATTERLLVSNRGQASTGVNAARQALRKGREMIPTVGSLLVAIVDHVVDAVDDYAESLAGSLDGIEEKIVAGERGDERAALGEILQERRAAASATGDVALADQALGLRRDWPLGPVPDPDRQTWPAPRLAGQ